MIQFLVTVAICSGVGALVGLCFEAVYIGAIVGAVIGSVIHIMVKAGAVGEVVEVAGDVLGSLD